MRIVWGFILVCFSQILCAEVQLEGVRIGTEADRTRVVFDVSKPVQYEVFLLAEPYRIVVDLKDTSLTGDLAQPGLQDNYIQRLRGARRDTSDFRVVLDLKQLADNQHFLLKPGNGYGNRLVVDIVEMGTRGGATLVTREPNDTLTPTLSPREREHEETGSAVMEDRQQEVTVSAASDEPVEVQAAPVPEETNVTREPSATPSRSGMPSGDSGFSPSLELTTFYDDNLLRGLSGTEIDTWGWIISPGLAFEANTNTSHFLAGWRLDAGFHEDSKTDDYVDNTVVAELEIQPTSRLSAGVGGEYKDTRDPRGTGRAEGLAIAGFQAEPDEWHHFQVAGNMAYGLETATARLEGDVSYTTKEYDNNRTATVFRDRDDTALAGRVFFQLAPKTSLVLEGRYNDYDYDVDSPLAPTLDSNDYQFLGGITWEALNKTTGTVKFGYIDKNFDAATRADSDAINWEVEVVWMPRTYSIVTLTTSRNFEETNGTGNVIERDTYSVNWTHYWQDRISSTVDFSYFSDSFDPTTREDDLIDAGVRLNYEARRWLTLSAGYRYDERDSNRNAFDYDRNLFLLTANITPR